MVDCILYFIPIVVAVAIVVAVVVAVVTAVVIAIMIPVVIPVVIAEMSSPSFPAPIVPFRSLPTEQRPWIVLNGNQRLYRADARIGNMTPAPVLNYAVRMLLRLLSAPVSVLPPRRQTRESQHAKRTHRHTHCGKNFSHDASPIDLVQRLASGHLTTGHVIKRLVVLRVLRAAVILLGYLFERILAADRFILSLSQNGSPATVGK
jgi:hypothetical protein